MRILITDGNERVTLAAARSLVRAGHEVIVTAPTRWSLAGVSRGVKRFALGADAFADAPGYVTELAVLVDRERPDILLPTTDVSVEAVLEHRALLPMSLGIPGPDRETYRTASDKARMLELAHDCGLAGPETRVLETPGTRSGELAYLFPAVIKPHRSVVTVQGMRRKLAVEQVADAAACDTVLARLPREAYPVLVQRQITGVGEGLFALRWDGRVVAMFAHRRLREKPPSGGVSVYRESIPLPPDLVRASVRMLDALDWRGVAMIECKRDALTGQHVLMEVNGRFWGSLQLAIDAGVDFPALLARCVQGEAVPLCHVYRTGVRSRWFWGDVDNLILRQRDREQRRGAVREFLRASVQRGEEEIFRWTDPLPFVVEALQWLGAGGRAITRDTAGAKRKNRATPTECVPGSAVP
ncbi:MAG TPA: ATP-grasp domain-containing protein [Gemmatimonadales bacterium]|nr:ATP-grasp domain-containing protein [Gemmatimonadales bacterium]